MIDESRRQDIKHKINKIDSYGELIGSSKEKLVHDAYAIGIGSLALVLGTVSKNIENYELISKIDIALMVPFAVESIYNLCRISGYKQATSKVISNLKNELLKNKIGKDDLSSKFSMHEASIIDDLQEETNVKGGRL